MTTTYATPNPDAVDVRDTVEAAALYARLDGMTVGGVAGLMALIRWTETGRPLPDGVTVLR